MALVSLSSEITRALLSCSCCFLFLYASIASCEGDFTSTVVVSCVVLVFWFMRAIVFTFWLNPYIARILPVGMLVSWVTCVFYFIHITYIYSAAWRSPHYVDESGNAIVWRQLTN